MLPPVSYFYRMSPARKLTPPRKGGKIKASPSAKVHYGNWNPNAVSRSLTVRTPNQYYPPQIFVIWTLSGISYGMVELIRRVM